MKSLSIVLAVALLASAAAAQAVCSSYTTCSTCIPYFPCGWCDQTQTCSNGTTTGPAIGTCPGWHWSSCATIMPTMAPGPIMTTNSPPMGQCSIAPGNCVACANLGGCGYCATTGTCMMGGSTGPLQGTCMNWVWISPNCPAASNSPMTMSPGSSNFCSQRTTCATCTPVAPCGWCPTTGTCMNGTFNGPLQGTCPGWAWVTTQCPTNAPAPSNCGMYSTCLSCAQHGSCGWCTYTKTCQAGSVSGPQFGNCPDWSWTEATCPSPMSLMKEKEHAKGHIFKKLA